MNKNKYRKIIEDRIFRTFKDEFQTFCDKFCLKLYPNDYQPVRSGGPKGDDTNDGYCPKKRIFFAAHATRGEKISKTKAKIAKDLKNCVEKHRDVKKWIFLNNNDKSVGEIETYIDNELRPKYKNIELNNWGAIKITDTLLKKFTEEEINEIMDFNFDPDRETKDFGIAEEIINRIIKMPLKKIDTKDIKNELNQTDFKQKIKLNFSPDYHERIESFILHTWAQHRAVEKLLEKDSAINPIKIDALKEHIQSDYVSLKKSSSPDVPIDNFQILMELAENYLPKNKKASSEYLAVAKAVVFYFFEICVIGKKTKKEKTQQQKLL